MHTINSKKQKISYIEGGLSVVINLLLFVLKLWLGLSTGSIAILADAWHTISDTATSALVIGGTWIASKPRDKDHPFGHGRAEVIAAIIIGTLLSVIAFSFLRESIIHSLKAFPVRIEKTALIFLIGTIIVKEAMASFSIRAGKKYQSHTLTADGWHHRSDALTTLLIVLGSFFYKFWTGLDGILGIGISLVLFYTAYEIIKKSSSVLIGEAPPKNLQPKIEHIAKSIAPEVTGIHHLQLHQYGDHLEMVFHLKLPSEFKLEKAHAIATKIENEIKYTLHITPTIHIEPSK
ncbi:cation diffusion facilitator family transporter [Thermoproteota archaeon]